MLNTTNNNKDMKPRIGDSNHQIIYTPFLKNIRAGFFVFRAYKKIKPMKKILLLSFLIFNLSFLILAPLAQAQMLVDTFVSTVALAKADSFTGSQQIFVVTSDVASIFVDVSKISLFLTK